MINLQVSASQCITVYSGQWPWRELQLVSLVEESAHVWQVSLQAVVDHLRQTRAAESSETYSSTIDYWLKCLYTEIGRGKKGIVTAVAAIEKFSVIKPWSAVKVSSIIICMYVLTSLT